MHVNLLSVVTCVANPVRWQSRIRLAQLFIEHMLDSGVDLTVVETAYGERPFLLADIKHIRHIPTRARTQAWSKKSALNVGIRALPPTAKYICWAAVDIEFCDRNWVLETVHALQLQPVVQPWSEALDLGSHGEAMTVKDKEIARSFGWVWRTNGDVTNWWKKQQAGEAYSYPHCLPGDSLVVPGGKVLAASARPFKGNLVIIRTASGEELSCSPSHPVFSDGKWVRADRLNVGDYVSSHVRGNGVVGEPDEKHSPARIENIVRAFRERPGVRRSTTLLPDDLDNNRSNCKVAEVWADGLLPNKSNPGAIKQRSDFFLSDVVAMQPLSLNRRGSLDLLPEGLNLAAPSDQAALASRLPPEIGGRFLQHALAYSGADLGPPFGVRSVPGRFASPATNFSCGNGRGVCTSGLNINPGSDDFPSVVDVHADNPGTLGRALSGQIERDQIVFVGRREFDGHLYDLKTGFGYIISDNILTHNSGYVWAATMDWYNQVGGLLDFSGLGAGDHQRALAMVGQVGAAIHGLSSDGYKARVKAWGDRCYRVTEGHVGYVQGRLEHAFHGDKSKRLYVERWDILNKYGFDPNTDLLLNRWNILELAGNKPEMQRAFDAYFRQRDEDAR